MFKVLVAAALLVLSTNVFAMNCDDDSAVVAAVEKTTSCYDAANIVNQCATYGSSRDLPIVYAGYSICEKELKAQNPNAKLSSLLVTMQNACEERYEKEEGTLYRSMKAFCNLDALKWILDLSFPI